MGISINPLLVQSSISSFYQFSLLIKRSWTTQYKVAASFFKFFFITGSYLPDINMSLVYREGDPEPSPAPHCPLAC